MRLKSRILGFWTPVQRRNSRSGGPPDEEICRDNGWTEGSDARLWDGMSDQIDETLEYNKKVNDVSAAIYGRGAHVLVCWLTTTTAVLGLITITMAS